MRLLPNPIPRTGPPSAAALSCQLPTLGRQLSKSTLNVSLTSASHPREYSASIEGHLTSLPLPAFYEKLPFFARLGVREMVIVDRDTKRVEISHLAGPPYVAVQPDHDGVLTSDTLNVRFTPTAGDSRMLGSSSTTSTLAFMSGPGS